MVSLGLCCEQEVDEYLSLIMSDDVVERVLSKINRSYAENPLKLTLGNNKLRFVKGCQWVSGIYLGLEHM